MDIIEAIKTRFSVRKYTDEPVSEEQLRTLLEAGFCAPSACNLRPWEFVVIRDRDALDDIAEHGRFQKMFRLAPLGILVCGNTKRSIKHAPGRDLLINDCSAAAENMLLAAHGIGLGGCWCGIADDKSRAWFSERFGLPDHNLPAALLAIGHPDETREQPDRYAPEKVHFEKF